MKAFVRAAALLALPLLLLLALHAAFRARLDAPSPDPPPRTAIVFTGAFARIEHGLRLMEAGALDRLFISGVNPGAGLSPARFAEQFRLSPALRAALAEGRIILAPGAETTLENAQEAACWLRARPGIRAAALITSRAHMPRALLALERASPGGVALRPLSPPGDGPRPGIASAEFRKFVATWFLTLAPRLRPRDESPPCTSS